MNLADFKNLEKVTGVYCELLRVKALFETTKKEVQKLETDKVRVFFLAVLQGANEGQILQLKVCIQEKEAFFILIKFYDFKSVLQAINYIEKNCACF